VTPERRAEYTKVIDDILQVSDLTVISAKQIRKGLAAAVDHDITESKVKDPAIARRI
jgi:upstream activation factor subunit UAF30